MRSIASPDGAFELRLHDSLWNGLTEASGIDVASETIAADEVGLLRTFAETCANPSGQKADLARSIAALAHVAGGLVNVKRERAAVGSIWDAVRSPESGTPYRDR